MVSDTANYLLIAIVPSFNNPLCTETAQVSMLIDCIDTLPGYRDIPSPDYAI
jgi:hypothetical protein